MILGIVMVELANLFDQIKFRIGMDYSIFKFIVIILLIMISPSIEDRCADPPENCSRDNIKFFLYTTVDEPPHEFIINDTSTIKNAKFNKGGNFKFMVHGFNQWRNEPNWMALRKEYFKQKEKNWNVIFLEYWPVAKSGCYNAAVQSLEKISECASTFLRQLFRKKREININQFHFIGFGLGAQICARISFHLRFYKMEIPRITGCDPDDPTRFTPATAEPVFILNCQHAKFVDVIHTNMGHQGTLYSSGHYDFYANDNVCQPGCNCDDDSCSHIRALKIFSESINTPTKFLARKCDSITEMISDKKCTGNLKTTVEVGEHCEPPEEEDEGVYSFCTHDTSPFAMGPLNSNKYEYHIKFRLVIVKITYFISQIFNFHVPSNI